MKQSKKLPPGIRRRTDGSFQIRYYVEDANGKPKRVHETVIGTLTEAKALRVQRLSEVQRGVHVVKTPVTVREYLSAWFDRREGKLAASTLARYRAIARLQVFPHIGGLQVAKLTGSTLEALYALLETGDEEKERRALSPTTVRQVHAILHACLKSAVRDGIIAFNPASSERIEAAPVAAKPDIRYLETEEFERLVNVVSASQTFRRFLAPVILGGVLGLRLGEMLGARWSDIDFEAAEMLVSRSLEDFRTPIVPGEPKTKGTLRYKTPKSGKKRRLSVPKFALDVLRSHRLEQRKHRLSCGSNYQDRDLIVPLHDGREWSPGYFARAFIDAAKALGFDVSFHGLRHTAIVALIKTGAHPKVVQEFAGHHSAAFTLDRYGHVSANMQREAAARLNDLYSGLSIGRATPTAV